MKIALCFYSIFDKIYAVILYNITIINTHENRNILIGKIDDKLWSAVFTYRKDAIRIISVRRARKREAKLYEKKEIS